MLRTTINALIVSVIAISGLYYAYVSFQPKSEAVVLAPKVVIVKSIQPQKAHVWSEFSARLQAVDSAEIKPEVSGRITEVRFEDGGLVNAGDVIFVIDPRPYEAAVARAEAKVATAVTNADFAKIELERGKNMVKTQAIAQRIYDERFNSNQVALASVKSAEADLKQANLDLEHAYVRAPITGRAGRVELTEGNLVQAGPNAPLLTRIIANDSIYADFEVDEQTYIENVRNVANDRTNERHIEVELTVQGDTGHAYKGTIYSFDNRLDPASGTIRARAKFDNSDRSLVPGMFVTVKLSSGKESEVLLVPQQALGFDQSKKFVYIIDQDNKVSYREVELGKEVKGQRIALKGLKPGDRVVIKGLQHIKPNEVVKAEEVEADAATTSQNPSLKEAK